MELQEFNIFKLNSGAITLDTPRALAKRLMKTLRTSQQAGNSASQDEDYVFRAITNIAVAAALSTSPAETSWLKDLIAFLEYGFGQSLRSDVANGILPYLSFHGRTVAFLPNMTDSAVVEEVFDGLSEIAFHEPHTSHWIFDCSEITEVNAAFIGHCIGLKRSIAQYGSRISFLWLPRTSLPNEFESILQKNFFLAKKGVFLLSSESKPH